jgi:hypothetical protein
MRFAFIARTCTDLPVSVCCRVMKVSTSGFYAWQANPVTDKDLDDAYLSDTIVDIWKMSRRSYGSPRVHAELRLDEDIRCSKKRVERLMAQAGVSGIRRRRRRGSTRRDPALEPSDDLVNRAFDPTEPNQLWVMDVTEHPTENGEVYVAVVLDAFSRMVIEWSIADHTRQSSSSMRSKWPSGVAGRHRVQRRPTPITGPPTRAGRSGGACAGPGSSDRWDRSATASITPWPRASSGRSSSSCWTSTAGRTASSSPSRSSS